MPVLCAKRIWPAAILFTALVARLAAIWRFGPSILRFGDAPDYLSAAATLCSTGSYPDHSSMPFFRAPGLPFFIAATTLCHTSAVFAVKAALAIVGTATVGIIWLLTEDLFLEARASRIASGIAAVYPFFVAQSSDIESEGLFMFFSVASVWLTLRAGRTDSWFPVVLAGSSAALAALVRPVGLLLLFLLPLQILITMSTNAKGIRRSRSVLLLLAGAAVCLAPWVIRNEIRFHELILVNDAGGYNFWRGTSAEMAAINRIADPAAFTKASIQFETVVSLGTARKIERSATTPESRSRDWYKLALENLTKDPRASTGRLLRNAWMYWRPWLNPATSSRAVVGASGLMVAALYLFGLHGWGLLRKRDARLALWFAVSALAFWISQIPFQVVSRFRIPITDPFLIVFAAASVCSSLQRYSPRRNLT